MPKIKNKKKIEQCTKIFIYRDLKNGIQIFLNKVTQAKLFTCAKTENPKTQWEKIGTYSPTDAVGQPLGVKGKNQSIDE